MPVYLRSSRARYFPNPVEFAASGVAVDVSNGNIRLADGGSIVTSNNGDLTLAPNGTGITKTSGFTTSHSLNASGDLGIGGELEVSGEAHFDGHMYYRNLAEYFSNLKLRDGNFFVFGTDGDLTWKWDDANGLVDCTSGGGAPLALPCPQVGNLPTLQTNNTATLGVDETNDELEIRVKDSTGTIRSATVSGLT